MFLHVLGYSVLAGLATIAGIFLILRKYKWAKHNSVHLMSFAAGIMLALAFLHLIPEALHGGHSSEIHSEELEHVENSLEENDDHEEAEHDREVEIVFITVLLGFAVFHALESVIKIHPRHDVEDEGLHDHSSLSIMSIVGLTFHSAIDGIIIAIGFSAGSQIGLMATIAIVLHEMPEGIVTTSILLHDGMERARILWFSLLVAIATPVGAVVSYFLLSNASESVQRTLLALAAGSFIYIAATDLIPETHKEEKRFNTVLLLVGVAILYILGRILGH